MMFTDYYGTAGRKLYLRRNEKNRGLCPVIAMMMWLSILRYVSASNVS